MLNQAYAYCQKFYWYNLLCDRKIFIKKSKIVKTRRKPSQKHYIPTYIIYNQGVSLKQVDSLNISNQEP